MRYLLLIVNSQTRKNGTTIVILIIVKQINFNTNKKTGWLETYQMTYSLLASNLLLNILLQPRASTKLSSHGLHTVSLHSRGLKSRPSHTSSA